jgi:hypothetical protein
MADLSGQGNFGSGGLVGQYSYGPTGGANFTYGNGASGASFQAKAVDGSITYQGQVTVDGLSGQVSYSPDTGSWSLAFGLGITGITVTLHSIVLRGERGSHF